MVNYQIIIAVVTGTTILMLLSTCTLAVLFIDRERLLRRSQVNGSHHHEIMQAQLEIREQTIKNISWEIHDNIGQILSLVSLQLSSIRIYNNPHAAGKISRSMELLSKASQDLRDLSNTMDGEKIARIEVIEAVKADLDLISRTGLISTSFHLEGMEVSLELCNEIIAYRIVQEALHNIIKHSKATNIEISFNYMPDMLIISVIDNGIGFDKAILRSDSHEIKGAGIRNITHRMRLIGGELNIETMPGKGTAIHLSIPILCASL